MEIDYKEKYMQAMERARQFREKPYLEDSAGIVEHIFPELSESEEERIRKYILSHLQGHLDAARAFRTKGFSSPFSAEEIKMLEISVAWLEKQGVKHIDRELSNLLNRVICRFINDPNIPYSERNKVSKKIIPYVEQLEKQGEQNIAEISNVCEFSIETWVKIVDYVLTEHNGIGNYLIDPEVKDTAEKLQKKYKFDAASEEWDRVYRKGLDAGVNKGRAEALREQKLAWSEEDETILKILNELVDATPSKDFFDSTKEKCIFWLKSIRPQSQWRASDEQIEALEKILKYFHMMNAYGETIDGLKELLEQLKKLREE